MTTLDFESILARPLAALWAFHEDVETALPQLSPPASNVQIESLDLPPRIGMRVIITARGPLGRRIHWVARYVDHQPPHPSPLGDEASFIDEQESGPFTYWRHEHLMSAMDANHSLLIDRVSYRVPLGPLGWIANALFVKRQICAMFNHRHTVMRQWAVSSDR